MSRTQGNLDLNEMFNIVLESGDPREAVCSWVAENIDFLLSSIPIGYPRNLVTNGWYNSPSGLLYAAIAIGVLAVFVVIVSSWLIFRYRRKRIIRNAQIDFQLLGEYLCVHVF